MRLGSTLWARHLATGAPTMELYRNWNYRCEKIPAHRLSTLAHQDLIEELLPAEADLIPVSWVTDWDSEPVKSWYDALAPTERDVVTVLREGFPGTLGSLHRTAHCALTDPVP